MLADMVERTPTLRTLDRGLGVLEAIAANDGKLTASELSRSLNLSRSTTYQLLKTLRESEYAVRGADGLYRLGLATERLADGLKVAAQPSRELLTALDRLFDEVGETSYLAGWRLSRITLQAVREGQQTLRVAQLSSGYDGHPHARASCRAILAFLDEAAAESYLESFSREALTPNTKTSLADLKSDLRVSRERGYAIDEEEFTLGVTCVAAPILGSDGFPTHCLSVSVPTVRARPRLTILIDSVRGAAERVSQGRRSDSA